MPPKNRVTITTDSKDYIRFARLLKKLGATDADFKKALRIETRNAVARMERAAPVDTGRLRRNIESEITPKGAIIQSEAIDPKTKVDYAPIQELPNGTLPIRTTPYFWRNVRQMQRKLFGRMNDIVTDILKRK